MPACRAERFLAAALDSLAAQTHESWELRVHEDGVFDESAKVIAGFAARHPGRVFHTATPQNRGVSRTRNRLLDDAAGNCIAFLDADDTWEPDHLATALAAMDGAAADWYIAGMNEVGTDGRVRRANVCPPPLPVEALPAALLAHNFIPTTFVVLRRKIVDAGFRFDPQIVVGEDLDLWLRMLGAGYVPALGSHATVNYRRHDSNTTNDTIRFHEEFTRVFEKHLLNSALPRGHCLRGVRLMLSMAIRMTWRNEPKRALNSLGRICRAYWISFFG